MSWDDFNSSSSNIHTKDVTFRSNSPSHFYAIFRVGKKYKTINSIKFFAKHMEREVEVQNADVKIKNEILIGSSNIYGDVQNYIKGIKLRSNAIIARELLMTASPDFFRGIMQLDQEQWKNDNVKWLKDNFGSNCIYATLHKDEKTWHIHALIVPKFKNDKGKEILSNTKYFDGIEKFRAWQDNYALKMQERFKCLNRGVKFSKAKHVMLKQYYTLVNKEINEKDINQLVAKAKNSELLEIKIKSIQKTLQVYKNYNSKNDLLRDRAITESKELIKEIDLLKENKEVYQEALSLLSRQYKIPQYVIKEAERQCEAINNKELEK